MNRTSDRWHPRSWLAGALALVAVASGVAAQDASSADFALDHLAFVEVEARPADLVRGQTVELVVRFGVERGFLRERALPLMRRSLDLPVQLVAPWAEPVEGLHPVDVLPPVEATVSVALHDGPGLVSVDADRMVDGRAFAVYSARRMFRVAHEVQLPPARLRMAYATNVQTDVFGNPIATDRVEGEVSSPARVLVVQPLPEAGRPPGFTGAVGRFAMSAQVSSTTLIVGEPFELQLVVRGDGDLAGFAPPDLSGWEHLHVLGVQDELDEHGRRLRYTLTPTSPVVAAIPAVPFVSYDIGPPAHWRTVVSAAIPVTVAGEASELPRQDADVAETPGSSAAGTSESPRVEARDDSGWSPWLALVGALIAGAVGFGWGRAAGVGRARTGGPPGREEVAQVAEDAPPPAPFQRQVWLAELERAGADPGAVAFGALSAWAGLSESALVDPRLVARLTGRGVSEDLAARVRELADRFVAARYGAGEPPSRAQVRALLEQLQTL